MKLPHREEAYIPPAKLEEYLLSETHSVGRLKARFLHAAGFDLKNPNWVKHRLIEIAQSEDVMETKSTPHGTKYVVEGSLQTPAGRLVQLRTVWIIETGQTSPRFVTAYPAD
ncbi:MAG: hypothetical protein FJ246_06125 [Nitrospira sp.]|nr:hypothetical protein [Nitrospira sp.]